MSLVDDEMLYARETVEEAWPIMQAHFPGCAVESEFLDVLMTWRHEPEIDVTRQKAFEVASELREKIRDSLGKEEDWHVRSLQPLRFYADAKNHPDERRRIGTRIWFSRSMPKPAGYDESDLSGKFIKAPYIRGEE
jgi:hypothetical protein